MTAATLTRLLLTTILLAPACAGRSQKVTLPDVETAGCPIILLTRTGGLGFESQGGVIAAVWSSGTILRSEGAAMSGPNHFIGTLAPADLASLTQLVQSPQTWDQPRGQTALDIPDDILTLRRGNDVRQWRETPGFTTTPVVAEFRARLFSVPVTRAMEIETPFEDVMKCAPPK